ncbi:MAG: aminotransferase class I/II-fold pyridoxal phosphate-dependent enzyme [Gammaproteobacteria bacterium]|nr:aminotransferase class I/II-fold pyridoxal phosphate-dependent enzyme [Gammaproteobacteria bacterium]
MNTGSPSLKSKFPDMGTTIFTVMSEMARASGAINLSQGYPDFEGPPALRERVAWHMANGHNQYAPLAGVPELLEQIALKVRQLYGCAAEPKSHICVTPGATEAIHCAVTACIHPGDEVIVFDPAYDTYAPCVALNGGVTRHIPLSYPDFGIDWQRVESEVNDRTRLIILNNPHNPTGSVWNEDDIESLRRLVAGRNILLLADEVYEHITFDGKAHLSLLRYPDLAARAFCIFSFGKTYHVTGWRVGYCVAPSELMREFLKVHQNISFSTNAPMQFALADFLRDSPRYHLELGSFYQTKRNYFNQILDKSSFILKPAAGSFFQLADYSRISDESDTMFAARLTREHKVAAIPVSVFYRNPPEQRIVRFCFAKSDQTLAEAARRLERL